MWTAATGPSVAIDHQRGDRGDALGELVADPRVAGPTDHDQRRSRSDRLVIVRGVNASRRAGRSARTSSVDIAARNTWPEETACIGAVVPVQSRTWTSCGVETWAMYRTSGPSAIDRPAASPTFAARRSSSGRASISRSGPTDARAASEPIAGPSRYRESGSCVTAPSDSSVARSRATVPFARRLRVERSVIRCGPSASAVRSANALETDRTCDTCHSDASSAGHRPPPALRSDRSER